MAALLSVQSKTLLSSTSRARCACVRAHLEQVEATKSCGSENEAHSPLAGGAAHDLSIAAIVAPHAIELVGVPWPIQALC